MSITKTKELCGHLWIAYSIAQHGYKSVVKAKCYRCGEKKIVEETFDPNKYKYEGIKLDEFLAR